MRSTYSASSSPVVGGEDRGVGDHLARGVEDVSLEVDVGDGDQAGLVIVGGGVAEQVVGACRRAVRGGLVGVAAVAVLDSLPQGDRPGGVVAGPYPDRPVQRVEGTHCERTP